MKPCIENRIPCGGVGIIGRVSMVSSLLLCLASMGCSNSGPTPPDPKRVIPAHGSVTLNGEPVQGVSVVFHRTQPEKPGDIPTLSSGLTQEDGSFKVKTYGQNDGIPPGDYSIAFKKPIRPVLGRPDDELLGAYANYRAGEFPITIPENVPDGADSFDTGTYDLTMPR